MSHLQRMSSLKGGKAGGKNGILPEMVKTCGAEMMDHILDLFSTEWREQRVPDEWRNAVLCQYQRRGISHRVIMAWDQFARCSGEVVCQDHTEATESGGRSPT